MKERRELYAVVYRGSGFFFVDGFVIKTLGKKRTSRGGEKFRFTEEGKEERAKTRRRF